MKKLFLISVLTVLAAACSNNDAKKEAEEKRLRDSMDNLQVDANQRIVDSLERADEDARRAAEKAHEHDSIAGDAHKGHNH